MTRKPLGTEASATATDLEMQMKCGTPEKCILLAHSASSIQMFYALRMRLEGSTDAWLREFLDLNGLDILLDALCQLTKKGFSGFSDAILQLDCIACVRTILNTHVGLDYMVRNDTYTPKLALVLGTMNCLCKKQVIEMMSAICAFNNLGYQAVLSALHLFRKETDQSHRFSIIVSELKSSETTQHKTAILTFINCVLNCTPDVVERCRLRNELEGLSLLDVIHYLKKEEVDEDLQLQLQIYHEKKLDDEELLSKEHVIDFNSPEDLVDLIQSKIFGTTKMVSFVNILQDLLAIESVYNKNSVKVWNTVDALVHKSIHANAADNNTSFNSLQQLPEDCIKGINSVDNYHLQNTVMDQQKGNRITSCNGNQYTRLQSGEILFTSVSVKQEEKTSDDTGVELTHNLGYRSKSSSNVMDKSLYDNVFWGDSALYSPQVRRSYPCQKLFKESVPAPSRKMKSLYWVSLTDSCVGKFPDCVWKVTSSRQRINPDYTQLEHFFSTQDASLEEHKEVKLLSPRNQQNINLFLGRLEISPEELVHGLEIGSPRVVNQSTLNYLMEILPDPFVIWQLQNYCGRRLELGVPEQFVLLLADIPNYPTLLEGHRTKLQYSLALQKVKAALNVKLMMCQKIIGHEGLREFIHLVLQVGNFLNYGTLLGNSPGFKVSSLPQLLMTKAYPPETSLLHYVTKIVNENRSDILSFVEAILPLDKAVSTSVHELKTDITKFNQQFCSLMQLIPKANHRLSQKFQPFIEEVRTELKTVQSLVNDLREATQCMANYFCEDIEQFDSEGTLKLFHDFCKQIKRCQEDNNQMNKQVPAIKQHAEKIKSRVKNRLLALEFGKDAVASSSIIEDKNKVLEKILEDLHRGNFRPLIKSEAHTPDADVEPLEFSNISFIGSPFHLRKSCDLLEADFLSPPAQNSHFRTSSAEDVLSHEPRKPKEISMDDVTICHAEDGAGMDFFLEKGHEVKPRARHHNRSRSDLGDSILISDKWMRYEELRQQDVHEEVKAPIAEPESSCALSTLHLENHGKFLARQDVQVWERRQSQEDDANLDVCSVPEGPVLKLPPSELQRCDRISTTEAPKGLKRQDKKSSVSNFFNKISRVMLKPRNFQEAGMTNSNIQNDGKGKERVKPRIKQDSTCASTSSGSSSSKDRFRMFGRRRTTSSLGDDKENAPVLNKFTDRMSQMSSAEKRRSLREMKRLRLERQKGQQIPLQESTNQIL